MTSGILHFIPFRSTYDIFPKNSSRKNSLQIPSRYNRLSVTGENNFSYFYKWNLNILLIIYTDIQIFNGCVFFPKILQQNPASLAPVDETILLIVFSLRKDCTWFFLLLFRSCGRFTQQSKAWTNSSTFFLNRWLLLSEWNDRENNGKSNDSSDIWTDILLKDWFVSFWIN